MDDDQALTADQVNALAEGTPITVIWSGGNGPSDCVIAIDKWGRRYAAPDRPNVTEGMRFYNPLHGINAFVGQERFNTRVWLRTKEKNNG